MSGTALLTDLYQLTMAYAHFKAGTHRTPAVFHLFFRENPFGGDGAVACGLRGVIELLEGWRFEDDDLDYLASLGIFDDDFLEHLRGLRLGCDVEAVPEGTRVSAGMPLVRVTGPVLEAQILETPLLTIVNFQTLVATKAARIRAAAGDAPILEFGLRRAQGLDGGLSASYAAWVGGCDATSNLLAGKRFGIPVKGTHAHSWVMFFGDEDEAFARYAEALPDGCVFLVDTYDSVAGVERAIAAGRALRARGHEMVGVRLDSGDLGELSRVARRMLDAAGFPRATVVASGDLDEHSIAELRRGGAEIGVFGVGTRLATAYDQPALGGVYKLAAVREGDAWSPRIKISDEPAKTTLPGRLQVRRTARRDLIYDEDLGVGEMGEDLLLPIFRAGRRVYDLPERPARPSGEARPVELEARLAERQRAMIEGAGRAA